MATKLKKTVTVEDIISWGPCDDYADDDYAAIRRIFGLRRRINVLESPMYVGAGVPITDVLWVLLRPEILGERECHLFACRTATRALKRIRKSGQEPDKRSWNAIAVKRRWLDGKASDEELSAARYSAMDAAMDAARYAARSAAWYAARSAAWDAAWDAERRLQFNDVMRVLRKIHETEKQK